MSVKWTKVEPNYDLDKKLYETFTTKIRLGYAEFGDEKTTMSIHHANIVDQCENFEVQDSDVFICSYPKTGTTWCQEMIWMIINNMDFEGSKKNLFERIPFLEFSGIYSYENVLRDEPDFQPKLFMTDSPKFIVDQYKNSPRFIKTHLPWSLLPRQIRTKEKMPKIIYTTRNAKDTCVSYFYHCVLKEGYSGDFETFCDLFLAGKLNFGNFWSHVNGFWKQRNEPNILLVRYEDMKQDLSAVIKTVASFLGKSLTEEQISLLKEHLSFESMKKNPAVNLETSPNRRFYTNNADGIKFLRSGTVGSYKKDMSPDIEKRFDDWIDDNIKKMGICI